MLKSKDINFSNAKNVLMGYDKEYVDKKAIFIKNEYTKLYNDLKNANKKIDFLEKSIQSLTIINTELEYKNKELEKRNKELEKRNKELEKQFKSATKDISILELAKQNTEEELKVIEQEETLEEIMLRNNLISEKQNSFNGFVYI